MTAKINHNEHMKNIVEGIGNPEELARRLGAEKENADFNKIEAQGVSLFRFLAILINGGFLVIILGIVGLTMIFPDSGILFALLFIVSFILIVIAIKANQEILLLHKAFKLVMLNHRTKNQ